MLRKEFPDTGVVPMVGVDLEDMAWKEARPVCHVTVNPTENYYLVFMGFDSCADQAEQDDRITMYCSHGWRAPGEA